jgi:hypothetical protein
MFSFFRRATSQTALDSSALGASVIALALPAGCALPPGASAVIISANGRARRVSDGGRLALVEGERAYCFHPGPYTVGLTPFAAAPELGLSVSFAIDAPDPRAMQQRFDLYLASEACGQVELGAFTRSLDTALQRELAQGNLALPPCTTLDEWNAFRLGLNQLFYTRFGVTVDDCVPVDLGESRDFAAMLRERVDASVDAVDAFEAAPAEQTPQPFDPAVADAKALRRLFLELPCVMCRLRLAVLPPGQELFRQQQALLQRLDQVSLSVGTMPALDLAAPGEPLAPLQQARRARHSRRAVGALDEAWALLARLERADDGQLALLFDEADRIVANLELDTAGRRGTGAPREAA